MPASRRAEGSIPVPAAALDPHGRGILLTVGGETRLVTPSQVATASALFGLPVEGLRRKLFDTGHPVHDIDDRLVQQCDDEDGDDRCPQAETPEDAFLRQPGHRRRGPRLG